MNRVVEKYFWVLLLFALVLGLVSPIYNEFFMQMLVPEFVVMLLFVFLKIDLSKVLDGLKSKYPPALPVDIYLWPYDSK